ncbi:MAG TPA: tetratricopeptide repeat protein [Burkholderiales bacterium]|nr:tetratricopeptide repeat protein [Burkholderiales bacterium]
MLNWLGKLLRSTPPAVVDQSAVLVQAALAQQQAGRYDEAERSFYRALALEPDSAHIHLHLGNLLRLAGRQEAALQCCLEAVRLAPEFAPGRNNLGSAYRDLGRREEAMAEFRRALTLDGGLAEAHFNLGTSLLAAGDTSQAIECYRSALRHRPGFALAHLNLGFLLEEAGDVSGAAAAYASAVAADPQLVEAHVNLGMQLLLAGRFSEGWPEYEWRLRYPEYGAAAAAGGFVRWNGAELAGKTILLDSEQGFGDAIQFLRYAALAADRGGRVVVRCAPELAGLFSDAPGVSAVVVSGAALPAFEVYCPLPSLPHLFGTTLDTIPVRVPYLHADAAKAARWKEKFAGDGAVCRVGLVWASQSKHRTAGAKSIPLKAMAPLAGIPGVHYYSLQKGAAAREIDQAPAGMRIFDLSGELADFSDAAAALANLDLVISVDTAVAHLAGALARPTWTLLKFAPDWRWLMDRGDCPWYPTMRLYRQRRPGDWTDPLAAIAQQLPAFSGTR